MLATLPPCLVGLRPILFTVLKNRRYGTKVKVSDIGQRNVWGAKIYGEGFTVRAKSLRWGIPKVDPMGQRLEFQISNSVMLRAQRFTVWGLRVMQKNYGGRFQK